METPLAVWGPAGTIITAMGYAIIKLYNALQAERDARINDLKEFQQQSKELERQSSQKERILYNKIEAARNGGR